jgi:hypothetical protein
LWRSNAACVNFLPNCRYKTEFVLWSLTQSPLIVDTDVRNMSAIMTHALLNDELVALHQSTATAPGTQIGYVTY